MTLPVRYHWGSLWQRKRLTAAAAVAAALAVFVFGSIVTLQRGVQKIASGVARNDNAIVLSRGAFSENESEIPIAQVATVDSSLGVDTLTTSELLQPRVFLVGTNWMLLQLRGVAQNSFALRPYVTLTTGRAFRPGTNEAIVGAALAPMLKGQTQLELFPGSVLEIVGTFTSGGSSHESEVWLDRDSLRDAFNYEHVSSVTVRLAEQEQLAQLNAQLAQMRNLSLEAKRESDYSSQLSRGFALLFGGIGTIVALVLALGAITASMTTMYGLIAARKREIGIFRALGFEKGAILSSFMLESLLLSLTGGLLGLAFTLILPFVTFDIPDALGMTRVLRFVVHPTDVASALGVAVLMGFLAGIFPAIAAARVAPAAAIRQQT